jgi:anthranilate phosphoribosyltransferase
LPNRNNWEHQQFSTYLALDQSAKPKAQVTEFIKERLADHDEAIQSQTRNGAVLLHGDAMGPATPCCDFLMHHTTGNRVACEHFGIKTCENTNYGRSPAQNGKIAMSVLKGDAGPPRQAVLLNALLDICFISKSLDR